MLAWLWPEPKPQQICLLWRAGRTKQLGNEWAEPVHHTHTHMHTHTNKHTRPSPPVRIPPWNLFLDGG